MSLSNYLENAALNQWLRNTSFAAIASVWASLHTADPGETGTGSPLVGAPRFTLAFNAAASATSVNSASASVVFSATGTVTHLGLWDGSATATANHIGSGALDVSRVVAVGDSVIVASGDIRVSLA